MKYDLVIKGGEVVDPAQGLRGQRDIGISQGKIAALAPNILGSEAARIINARGKIVTPGLIDLHAHVAGELIPMGTIPDEAGVLRGVTTVCDGGSLGHANFKGLKKFVIPQARTDVFCFLHICSTGLAIMPEVWGWHGVDPQAMLRSPFAEQAPRAPYCWNGIDPQATLRTVEENRGIIKGIKYRAIGTMAKYLGIDSLKVAKKVAVEAGLPLMVHIGIDEEGKLAEEMSEFTRQVLPLLTGGDIISHMYTWKRGGLTAENGAVYPEAREAKQRGVIFDVAPGKRNFRFKIAEKLLSQGILPDVLSTDLNEGNINGPVFSLTLTMSKFIALGLTLDQTIAMTTINPARALGEDHRRGSLRVGMPADVSILEMVEGTFIFSSGDGNDTLAGKRLLVPKLTLKSGEEIAAQPPGYLLPSL